MVSVCIATYNGERFLREQLDSILPQLADDDEIIISDDNSTDGTLSVAEGLNDRRIKIVKNQGDHGYTPNFENALRHTKGDYIFLSDQDDIWFPDRVERTLMQLKTADLVVCDARIVDEEKNMIHPSYFKERVVYTSWIGNLYRFGYLGCCQAFRRSVLERALPFPEDHLKCTHDNWLFMVAKSFGKVGVIDSPLIMYRRHSNTASDGGRNEHKSWIFRISYRLYLAFQLLRRSKKHITKK